MLYNSFFGRLVTNVVEVLPKKVYIFSILSVIKRQKYAPVEAHQGF